MSKYLGNKNEVQWVSKDRKYGGMLSRLPDGTQQLSLDMHSQLLICKDNNARLSKDLPTK